MIRFRDVNHLYPEHALQNTFKRRYCADLYGASFDVLGYSIACLDPVMRAVEHNVATLMFLARPS
jgi:hypothetical protein